MSRAWCVSMQPKHTQLAAAIVVINVRIIAGVTTVLFTCPTHVHCPHVLMLLPCFVACTAVCTSGVLLGCTAMLVQVAAGITWGLGMSSFISNHPEFSATEALDFLERGHERQNKLALQQAAAFAAEAEKAAAARAEANAAASTRAAGAVGASTARTPAAGDAATGVATGGAAAPGGTGAAAGTHAAGASTPRTTTAAGGDAATGATEVDAAADETAGGTAGGAAVAAESAQQPQQQQPEPDREGLCFV